MSFLASHWDAIVGGAGFLFGAWQRQKAAKARAEAERTATELDLVRAQAGTKATWEETLVTDARAARALGKTPPPGWPTGQ
jgi:deoxyribose-phosphate aldolase